MSVHKKKKKAQSTIKICLSHGRKMIPTADGRAELAPVSVDVHRDG